MNKLSDVLNQGSMIYIGGCYAEWSIEDNKVYVVRKTSLDDEYYYIENNCNYLLSGNKIMVVTEGGQFIQIEVYELKPIKLEH